VVILNWNGRNMLEKYLPSVMAHSSRPGVEVIVADNGSTDDSVSFLKEAYPSLKLIRFEKNHGFAGGYNKALLMLESDYFILLNSDVEVTSDWISPLLEAFETDQGIAACMPKIRSFIRRSHFEYAGAAGGYLDSFGYPFCRGRVFDHVEEDQGQYDQPEDVFWATGACLCIRADLFKQTGGFDDRFFAHMEEIDLCWRLQNMGYRIRVCPGSVVYHYGGGALPPENPFKTYLNFRNNLLMLFKNLNIFQLLYILPVRLLMDWLSILKFLLSGRMGEAGAVIRAQWSFVLLKPGYLKLRRRIPHKKNLRNLRGYYHGSIVWEFFIRKRKKFSDLNPFRITSIS
jgi:GT2 family glycosyltransferase